ncbi:membrane fusion protein, macrolide-specific efflux system [Mesorhizobium albiziae]|uniref:Membrane fusion protein, macrolide-specific efflux system n=1 Tax=Neomesorhizobium albiziae TaxID=335020 RepID=A0A1I3ZQP6_9HYPH|nr:efflux RND transporter periplasmic adaptor subunit [Mesorhizobium albiziae]SFK46297.1 membrane fusion protein, macrolide-specific efflux system [Mesorhizobium albiziae]
MKGKARALVWVLGIAPVVFAIASATGAFEGKKRDPVLTEPVVLGSVEETVLANGVLEPARMVSVGAQVSGQLKALHVVLGQTIKAGDLIAEIDSTQQQNALRTAEAKLADVKAQRKGRGIELKKAELVFRREKTLSGQKAASAADLEKAQAEFLTLETQVESLEAQIAQSTVEVENARAKLDYTKVSAPMDGVVVAVVTKAGQTLNSNQDVPTIVVLAQLDVMRVKVQISEADIARVKPGQKVRFTIMGDTRTATAGVLEQIEPAPESIANDPSTVVTTGAEITAPPVYYNGLFATPNPEGRLRPMMSAVVTVICGHAENVPLVAWSALTERDEQGRYHVQVRTPTDELTERLVTIGLTDRIKAQVIDGLAVGDEVVIPADGEASDLGAW